MKHNFFFLFLLSGLAIFSSCLQNKKVSHITATLTLEQKYQNAIADAAYPSREEIYNQLVAINNQNTSLISKQINNQEYILVCTWKGDTSYYFNNKETGFYNTGKYPIWVTVAPELLNWAKQQTTTPTQLRLKQLFGLPSDSYKEYFIEFWVKPSDLFRPCPDAEITDNVCQICFDANATNDHKNWINQTRLGSYFNCELNKNYPFTALGYTYDWGNDQNHVGLSEFVIKENANIVVHKIYATQNYLKNL